MVSVCNEALPRCAQSLGDIALPLPRPADATAIVIDSDDDAAGVGPVSVSSDGTLYAFQVGFSISCPAANARGFLSKHHARCLYRPIDC